MPTCRDVRHRIGVIVGKAADRGAQPVSHQAAIVAPQYVGPTVAIEVAGARHLPGGRNGCPRVGKILSKAAAVRA